MSYTVGLLLEVHTSEFKEMFINYAQLPSSFKILKGTYLRFIYSYYHRIPMYEVKLTRMVKGDYSQRWNRRDVLYYITRGEAFRLTKQTMRLSSIRIVIYERQQRRQIFKDLFCDVLHNKIIEYIF